MLEDYNDHQISKIIKSHKSQAIVIYNIGTVTADRNDMEHTSRKCWLCGEPHLYYKDYCKECYKDFIK